MFAGARLLAASLLSCGAAAADNIPDALLSRAGADGLGYLRIEQPETALAKMDGITRKLGGRVGDLLPLVAQRFLKNPMLAGVDLSRPCTVLFLNPARYTNNLAIVVGVANSDVFLDSFGKGGISRVVADPATADTPVRHFSETVEEFDQRGFIAALRGGGQPDPEKFKKEVTRHYFVTVRGGEGAIVGDRGLLAPAKAGAFRVTRAIKGDITAACNVPGLLGIYGKEIRQQQQAVVEMVQAAAARSGAQAGGNAAVRRGRIYAAGIGSLLAIAEQVRGFEVGAELDDEQLAVRFNLQPLANTLLAKSLAAQSPAALDPGVMALMPADAAMLSCWQVAQTPEMVEFHSQHLLPILQAAAPAPAEGASVSFADLLRESMAIHDGAVAAALKTPAAGESGFDMVQAYRVRDARRARDVRRRAAAAGIQAVGGLLSEAGVGGVKYQVNVARHAGIEVDEMNFDLKAVGGAGASQSALGSNMVSRVAFTGRFGLNTTGSHAAENMRQLIDLARKPPSAPPARPRFDAATAAFPKRLNGVFFLKLEDYFRVMTGAMPAAVAADGGRLRELLDKVEADIAGYLILAGTAATGEVVLPLGKLLDLSRKAPTMPPAQ